jgi:hypothetical protein
LTIEVYTLRQNLSPEEFRKESVLGKCLRGDAFGNINAPYQFAGIFLLLEKIFTLFLQL